MKVFISHSGKDKHFARRLAIDLEDNGIQTWFDEWELKVGDSLIDELEKGLRQSDYVIAVLSSNSVRSRWVREELKSALSAGIEASKTTILPALYEDCDIPPFLRDRIYADFRQDYLVGLNSILRAVKSTLLTLPQDIKVKIEEKRPLTRDDLVVLKGMMSKGTISLNSEMVRHVTTYSLTNRCDFSYWFEQARQCFDTEVLRNLIQRVLPFRNALFQEALTIALCDDAHRAMEILYGDLGIKSIISDGHIPFRSLRVYLHFSDLLEYLARIPTPTVVWIFENDILGAYGDYKFFGLRYAAITREPKVLETLLELYLTELEEPARERIILALTEQLSGDELAELIFSSLDNIKAHSHVRWYLIQDVNILPPKVRLHLLSICWDDEYIDIRTAARDSILEHEKALFIKLGFKF